MLLEEKKANLFIVGAMKSATTSLYFHLKEHPDVFLCEPKEPNFFCNQELRHCSVGSHAKKYISLMIWKIIKHSMRM